MIDLAPGSEGARITRMAAAIVSNVYPLGYEHGQTQEEALRHNRCIETARALHDTLQALGLPAKLMPVDIVVKNPLAYQLSEKLIPINQWPKQAWSVGIVDDDSLQPTTGGGWSGHMLVRVAREWLCDPNAGQFYRKGRIHMPPAWTVQYPKEQWSADREGWAMVGIITKDTPTPEHPEFPIAQVRQRPDNTKWRGGTAANNDVSGLVSNTIEIIDAIRRGDSGRVVAIETASGEMVNLDLSTVIARYKGEGND